MRHSSSFSYCVIGAAVFGENLRHRGDVEAVEGGCRIGNQTRVVASYYGLCEAGMPDVRSKDPTD